MGNEQRFKRQEAAIRAAEIERVAGPVKEFGSVESCPKCRLGNDHVLYQWCAGKNILSEANEQCPQFGEHNHRLCPRCKYGWFEHCADHEHEYVPDSAEGTVAE